MADTVEFEKQSSENEKSFKSEEKKNTEDEQPVRESSIDDKSGATEEKQADSSKSKSKIDILLKPTGDAPIMKKKKWAVPASRNIGSILEFMRKYLSLGPADSLFLYVNQSFAPSPDQELSNLFECFGSDGKLVLHYAMSQAWG